MKKEIILVRHGKACSLDAFNKDIDRVLIDRGVNDGYKVAGALLDAGIKPSLILTSPAARASHTALIFARTLNLGSDIVKVNDRLFHCSPSLIMDLVTGLSDKVDSVAIVAHNPGLTDLAYELTKGQVNFMPTTGVTVLRYNVDSWAKIGGAVLENFISLTPKEIEG